MNMNRLLNIVVARYKANTVEDMDAFGPCGFEPEALQFLQQWYDAHAEPKPTPEHIVNAVYEAWNEYSCNAGEPIPMLTEEILREDEFFVPEPIYEDIEIDTPQGTVFLDADMCKLFHIPQSGINRNQ